MIRASDAMPLRRERGSAIMTYTCRICGKRLSTATGNGAQSPWLWKLVRAFILQYMCRGWMGWNCGGSTLRKLKIKRCDSLGVSHRQWQSVLVQITIKGLDHHASAKHVGMQGQNVQKSQTSISAALLFSWSLRNRFTSPAIPVHKYYYEKLRKLLGSLASTIWCIGI